MIRFVLGFVFAILVLAVVGVTIMFTGAYNVAASARHSAIENWVLTTTMRNSVQRRAGDITVPASITEDQVRRGFAQFRDSCVYCHGAPGVDATDWAQGLQPEPPYLPDVIRGRPPAQLFWIVRNGINMTAMPAFGKHHGDQDIWGVVGFIQRLPDMSAEEYARLGREADEASQAAGAAPAPTTSPNR
jgi:mono/diheme cytochrome c family protein